MTEEKQRRPRPSVPYGPTAKTVAEGVQKMRKRRQLTIYELSALLKKAGRPITPSAIAKIERGERRVDVDDLMALTTALGVSPAALLLPLKDSPHQSIEITGAGEVPADVAWEWASNERSLPLSSGDASEAELGYQLHSLPPGRRYLRSRPVGRAVEALRRDVDRVVEISQRSQSRHPSEFADRLAAARLSLGRLEAELARMEAEREEFDRSSREELERLRQEAARLVEEQSRGGGDDGAGVD
ncbi:helix-turn-helix domain-containing protein [Streptomyces alkaliphilus]|nr:helix-turn-helix transcriptional regulator [Streptomyces alkaliphilus]